VSLPGDAIAWFDGQYPSDCRRRGALSLPRLNFRSHGRFPVHGFCFVHTLSQINGEDLMMMKKLLAVVLVCALALTLAACGSNSKVGPNSVLKTGVLRVGMECAYAPYNWTQSDDSNGAVPIHNSSDYANGYDVMMAKKIAEANNWKLEIHKLDWDSIPLAVQSGEIDAAICGQSITAERMQTVDFTTPYYYASIVTLVKADSKYANATGISDLEGATCTSQLNTVWYDVCLPQIKNAKIMPAQETAPAMLVSVASGAVELVCTDYPTALAAVVAYPELKLLDFTDTDDNYNVSEEEINIGISCMKGNTELVNKINDVLKTMTVEDYEAMMKKAINIQPLSE
jgi:putative lysine transport system substrate-binding protein